MFYTYLLRSQKTNELYIGYTKDLRKRLTEHNSGLNRATKGKIPWELIYYEAYKASRDATKREKMLKIYGRTFGGLKRRLSLSLSQN